MKKTMHIFKHFMYAIFSPLTVKTAILKAACVLASFVALFVIAAIIVYGLGLIGYAEMKIIAHFYSGIRASIASHSFVENVQAGSLVILFEALVGVIIGKIIIKIRGVWAEAKYRAWCEENNPVLSKLNDYDYEFNKRLIYQNASSDKDAVKQLEARLAYAKKYCPKK